MTFSTRNFDPLTPLAPKFPNFAIQMLLFRSKLTVAVVTHAHVLQNFYTTLVLWLLAKNNVQDQNWRGLGQKSIQKFGTPYVFLQPSKLATSNLIHNLGLGLAYQKTTFWTKLGGGLGQGSIQKNWDPLCIFSTVEASNFKFGTQLRFGTSLPKNVLDQNWRGSGPGEHPKKIWDPLRTFATVEANNYKFGTQIRFGTSLPKNDGGLGQGSIQKKFGTSYLFLQPLKLATSNLVHNLVLGLAYQKTF